MKCVRHTDTGEVHRVSDREAMRRVTGSQWRYVPKSLWKAQQRAGGKNQNAKK